MKSIKELARPNVFVLFNEKKIDTTLRDLENDIFLDKNEMPYNNTLSRYSFESNTQLNTAFNKDLWHSPSATSCHQSEV